MLLLKILRFFIGYVYFTAEGGFAERFLNLCNKENIHIKDAELYGNNLKGCVAAGKYKKIHKIAVQSGVKLKSQRKYGLVFSLRKHKKRVALFTGFIYIIFFLVYTSSFIWTIDVAGAERISDAEVIKACETLGLKEGVLKRSLDTNELSRLLIMELSGKVSWISVNVKGTKATVELRDYAKWKEDTTYGKPSNIVADFDGLLMTLEVYNGVKIAKEGNGVKKGDLLISGIAENRDTSSQLMEARGRITALHSASTETVQKDMKLKRYTYTEKIKILGLFGLRIPMGYFKEKEEMFDEFENKKSLYYGKSKIPLSVSTVSRAYYKTDMSDADYSLYTCADIHTIEMYEKFKNTLLLSSESRIENKQGKITIKTTNECVDFMGVKEEIYIE